MHEVVTRFDPLKLALAVLAPLVCASLIADARDPAMIASLNFVLPVAIGVVGGAVATALVLSHPHHAISPIAWFYLAAGAYYGIGPLVFDFGNAETVEYIQTSTLYPIDEKGIFRANTLSAAGVMLVTVFILLGRWLMPWHAWRNAQLLKGLDLSNAKFVLLVFIVVGGIVKYGFTLPHTLGLLSWTLPGAVQQLSYMLQAAVIISILLVARGERAYVPVMWALILTEIGSSAMTYSKLNLLLTIATVGIGWHLTQRRIWEILMAGLAVIALYTIILSPFVAFARENFRAGGAASLTELVESLASFIERQDEASPLIGEAPAVQGWWSRFTFSNFQAFAIDTYNSGQPGTSLDEAYYVLVPRVIYPDKPAIGFGAQFSEILNPGSSAWLQLSMGYFAEGYWNGGVAGLVLVSAWVGLILAFSTWLVFSQLGRGQVVMLFPALLLMQMGTSVEAWFVGTFIGGFVLTLLYAAGALLVLGRSTLPPSPVEVRTVS